MPKKDWKEHGNSSWDSDKRNELLELIRMDVSQKDACRHVGLAVSTLHDWLNRDKKLSEQYDRAETYMDVISGQVIQKAIREKEDVKTAMEYKRRRDQRYSDKQEVEHTGKFSVEIMQELPDEELLSIINGGQA